MSVFGDDDRPDEPLPDPDREYIEFKSGSRIYIMRDGSNWDDGEFVGARKCDTWTREEMR